MPFPNLLDGRITAITGATRGIGLATAIEFGTAGATVIMLGRTAGSLDQAAMKVREAAPEAKVETIVCDVADSQSVRDAFQRIFKTFKALHVLVSNAGVLDDALIDMVSRDQIERTFGVNTFGVLYCAQYASRLIARSGGGSIVNISSIIGTNGNVGQAVYGGSKAAVIGITKSLAKELASKAIRVNAIAPGFIDTDMARSIPPEKYRQRVDSVKMGYAGSPSEIAKVALFLASDMSTYVTGQVIGVDGGMLI
jgi:3-oxoacyl-[acyl-carrier protein] reductase